MPQIAASRALPCDYAVRGTHVAQLGHASYVDLQRIVNRSEPRLYLVQDRYDELWLDWLRERGDINRVEWLEVGQVFERFLPEVKQMFVTDPGVPASVHVATMLAAVDGGLVATPETAAQ